MTVTSKVKLGLTQKPMQTCFEQFVQRAYAIFCWYPLSSVRSDMPSSCQGAQRTSESIYIKQPTKANMYFLTMEWVELYTDSRVSGCPPLSASRSVGRLMSVYWPGSISTRSHRPTCVTLYDTLTPLWQIIPYVSFLRNYPLLTYVGVATGDHQRCSSPATVAELVMLSINTLVNQDS